MYGSGWFAYGSVLLAMAHSVQSLGTNDVVQVLKFIPFWTSEDVAKAPVQESLTVKLGIPDTEALVGKLFQYTIPDTAFSGNVDKYEVHESGSNILPSWMYFNQTCRCFMGVPMAIHQGLFYLEVTARRGQQDKATTHFLIHVHATQVLSQAALDIQVCDWQDAETGATLLLDISIESLSAAQRVLLLQNFAHFLNRKVVQLSLGPKKAASIAKLLDTKILMFYPANVTDDTGVPQVELSWTLACGSSHSNQAFNNIMKKNLASGILNSTVTYPIRGWYISEKASVLRARHRRQAAFGTPVPTPTFRSSVAPTTFTSSELHTSAITVESSSILPTTSLVLIPSVPMATSILFPSNRSSSFPSLPSSTLATPQLTSVDITSLTPSSVVPTNVSDTLITSSTVMENMSLPLHTEILPSSVLNSPFTLSTETIVFIDNITASTSSLFESSMRTQFPENVSLTPSLDVSSIMPTPSIGISDIANQTIVLSTWNFEPSEVTKQSSVYFTMDLSSPLDTHILSSFPSTVDVTVPLSTSVISSEIFEFSTVTLLYDNVTSALPSALLSDLVNGTDLPFSTLESIFSPGPSQVDLTSSFVPFGSITSSPSIFITPAAETLSSVFESEIRNVSTLHSLFLNESASTTITYPQRTDFLTSMTLDSAASYLSTVIPSSFIMATSSMDDLVASSMVISSELPSIVENLTISVFSSPVESSVEMYASSPIFEFTPSFTPPPISSSNVQSSDIASSSFTIESTPLPSLSPMLPPLSTPLMSFSSEMLLTESVPLSIMPSSTEQVIGSVELLPSTPVYASSSADYAAASSAEYLSSSQQFVTSSPAYLTSSADYVTSSVEYLTSSPEFLSSSTGYLTSSANYMASNAEYLTSSPEFLSSSTGYVTSSDKYLTTTLTTEISPSPTLIRTSSDMSTLLTVAAAPSSAIPPESSPQLSSSTVLSLSDISASVEGLSPTTELASLSTSVLLPSPTTESASLSTTILLPSSTSLAISSDLGEPVVTTMPVTSLPVSHALPTTSAAEPTTHSTTTGTPNKAPIVMTVLSAIHAPVGVYFELIIPTNTFYDFEDGDTRNLKLTVLNSTSRPLQSNYWLQFDSARQMFYGLPLKQDVGVTQTQVLLVATDKGGLSAGFFIRVTIDTTSPELSHLYYMYMDGNLTHFLLDEQYAINLIKKIGFYFDDPGGQSIRLSGVRSGSVVVVWSNSTLSSETCENETILATYEQLQSPSFHTFLLPEYVLQQVKLELMGMCVGNSTVIVTPIAVVGSNTKLILAIILPILILILIILLIVCLCLYRNNILGGRSNLEDEKPMFAKGHRPMLLASELEMKDPYNRSKRPVFLDLDERDFVETSFQGGADNRGYVVDPPERVAPPDYYSSVRAHDNDSVPPVYKLPPPYALDRYSYA